MVTFLAIAKKGNPKKYLSYLLFIKIFYGAIFFYKCNGKKSTKIIKKSYKFMNSFTFMRLKLWIYIKIYEYALALTNISTNSKICTYFCYIIKYI